MFITRPKIWCDEWDFCKKDMWDPCEQILDEERRESLAFEKETVSFPIEEGVSISDHINTYTKLLADLANIDVVIDEEDKALILLSSLPDNGRTSLSYSEVTTTLVNLGLRRKDKKSFGSTSVEALTVRGRSPNQRGEYRGRSKSRSRYGNHSLTYDQCTFCKQTGHWKKDCPQLKKKNNWKRSQENHQRWMSPSQMSMNLILLLSHSLSHCQHVTRMLQSHY